MSGSSWHKRNGWHNGQRRRTGSTGRATHKVFTKFVVIDIAGNPLVCFDTMEEAKDAVENEYRGRRIVEQSYTNRGGDMRCIL